MHRHGSLRDTAETYARDVLAIGPDDVTFSVAKFFFAYGLGNTLTFPFSVGARHGARPLAAEPGGHAAHPAGAPPDAVLRRAHLLRGAARPPACPRTPSPACGPASRPARRSPPRCSSGSPRRSASRCSTASARPRCCTSSSATGPGRVRAGTSGEIVAGYEARIQDDDGQPGARRHPRPPLRAGQLGGHRLLVPHRGHPPGLPGPVGAHRRHLRPRRPTATTPRWAAPTTSSRPAASGSPPPRSRSGCAQHPDVNLSSSSRCPTPTGWTSRSPASSSRPARRPPPTTWSASAGRGWPRSSGPATSSSSTSCRPPPPASCSASASASWPSPGSATPPDRRRPRVTATDTLLARDRDRRRPARSRSTCSSSAPGRPGSTPPTTPASAASGRRSSTACPEPGGQVTALYPEKMVYDVAGFPGHQGPRPGRRAGRAGRPLRPGLRARRAGRAPHQRGRAPPARRRPARRHHRQGHPDQHRRRRHHRRHRHLHPAPAARRRGVGGPRPDLRRQGAGRPRRAGRRHRRRRRQRRRLGAGPRRPRRLGHRRAPAQALPGARGQRRRHGAGPDRRRHRRAGRLAWRGTSGCTPCTSGTRTAR